MLYFFVTYNERPTTMTKKIPQYFAFHEAGHAIADFALGHDFIYMAVYDEPRYTQPSNGTSVLCQGQVWKGDDDRIYQNYELAIVSLAGPYAEIRHRRCSAIEVFLSHGLDDMEKAIEDMKDSKYKYVFAESGAKSLIRDCWPAVSCLAEVLHTRRYLTYQNALEVMEPYIESMILWRYKTLPKLQVYK
jgi:hypothetical protein